VAALVLFGSIRGALERRVSSVSFVSAGDGALHRVGDYRGKIVVLNFWATWCPPCRTEMPDLNRLADAHRGGDVVVIAISDETWDAIRAYTDRFPMSTVVGRFTSEPPRGSVAGLAYKGRPTTIVVGRDGRVRRQLIGARDYGSFEDAVRAAM
jgi:thiol-disulfide isomerase/thioredoxin